MSIVEEVEQIFCPKCKSTELEADGSDQPSWIANDQIGATEYFVCSKCGHEFTIGSTYNLADFIFLDEDVDGKEYLIKRRK